MILTGVGVVRVKAVRDGCKRVGFMDGPREDGRHRRARKRSRLVARWNRSI